MLLRRRKQRQTLPRRPADPRAPIEAMEEGATPLVSLEHRRDRLALIESELSLSLALRIRDERFPQLIGEPEIVDDEPTRLIAEDAIDARDRLHEPVPPHGLINVHRVHAWGVEAREPHIAHDDDLERVVRIFEALGETFATTL